MLLFCFTVQLYNIEVPLIFYTVPAVPNSCNISLSYNQSSKRLLLINSTWNTVPVSHVTSLSIVLTSLLVMTCTMDSDFITDEKG